MTVLPHHDHKVMLATVDSSGTVRSISSVFLMSAEHGPMTATT